MSVLRVPRREAAGAHVEVAPFGAPPALARLGAAAVAEELLALARRVGAQTVLVQWRPSKVRAGRRGAAELGGRAQGLNSTRALPAQARMSHRSSVR